MCFTVQLSWFILFRCLATAISDYHIFRGLSTTFLFDFSVCSNRKIKRRRRDLNPRAAVNDLHPFQGCPFGQLGYFSKLPYLIGLLFSKALFIIPMHSIYVKHFLNIFHLFLTSLFTMPDQRREWDSNPRALADKRFSRPPRYDHFDISPCAITISAQIEFYH